MTNIITVVSTRTGKIHKGIENVSGITLCNHSGQNRSVHVVPIGNERLEMADDSMFCKKCFPNGKPE